MSRRALRREPRWLTWPSLLEIHAQQVESYGGAHGILDESVVLSTLERPRNRWWHDSSAALSLLAAMYLVGFAGSQGFRDGNKRTDLACALVFLSLNGAPLLVPPADLHALTMAVANDQVTAAAVAAYLRDRLEPAG